MSLKYYCDTINFTLLLKYYYLHVYYYSIL